MITADDYRVIARNLPSIPRFRGRPLDMAQMQTELNRLADAQEVQPFAFDGRHTFHTRHGRWVPEALPPALMLFLTAHCKGGEVPIFGVSYGAAHGALNRQIESLYRVDPELANALAFARGSDYGLHLRRDPRHGKMFYARWQAPQGLRLGPPMTGP